MLFAYGSLSFWEVAEYPLVQISVHMQVRYGHKYGQGNGHLEEVTSGGNALKFYAAIRLRLVRLALMKTEDKVKV